MDIRLLLTSVAVLLLILSACGGGSSSGSSAKGGDPVTTPTDDTPVPGDYIMPPLVDVVPPSEDFAAACEEIVLPENNELPPGGDGSAVGSLTGYLVDSPVSGLAWETPTGGGVTDPDGAFHYEEGEAVRFLLGDTLLGEVTAQAQVTPFDLAGSPVVTGMSAITEALQSTDHPFHTVINIAVLLQSLDLDAAPDNGIEITPEVAALFQGVSIDLNQHWEVFLEEFRLRYALAQANALGLFDAPRGVSSPALATQHLYQTLEIDARTLGLNLEQSDEVGDDTPEDINNWQYDVNGNVTRRDSSVSDGRLQSYESWIYDTRGDNTVYESVDFGQQSTYSRAYNALGNLSLHQADIDGDGYLDIHDTWRYQYGEGGKLIRAEREDLADTGEAATGSITGYQYGIDDKLIRTELNGGDLRRTAEVLGIPDIQYLELAQSYSVTYQYDANSVLAGEVRDGFNSELGRNTETRQFDIYGNVTRVESRLEQFDSSEAPQITITAYQYQYDANGNVTRKVTDDDDNGKPDDIERYQYDAHGNVTREASDWDANGEPDSIVSYQYNEQGKVTQEVTDWDADGKPDQIVNYEYDAVGNLSRIELDYDADGTADEIQSWSYQYEYDKKGNLVRRVLDQSGDGTPNEIVSYTYYAGGNLAQEDYWSTEGEEHYIRSSQYDTRGKLLREEFDHGGDGTPETIVNYEYDACAARTRREARDGESSENSVESWRYDARGQLRRYEWNNRPIVWPYDPDPVQADFASWQSDGFEGWQYDVGGQLTRYQLACQGECFDDPFNSLENQLVNYEYDSNGNVTRELYDQDGDSKPDRVTVYDYNGDGKVVRELIDENGDGSANRVTSFQYDSNGKLTRREEDNNGDGVTDQLNTIEYDSHGNVTQEWSDDDGDGTPERVYTIKHMYDADGNRIRLEEDGDEDGIADYIIRWEYDASGNETRMEHDEGGDGVPEHIEIRKYDINNNLVREEMYGQDSGTPEHVRSYVYDADGNLTSETDAYDWGQDGIVDNIETRHYAATGWGHIFASEAGEHTQ